MLLERWNDIGLALSNAFAASSLVQQVHPDAAIREQAEAAEVEAHRLLTDLSLDREVYDLLVVDDADQRTTGLDDEAERVRNFALRDFRRSGVDRDEATRDRVRAINERETELGQTFERHIRDDDTTVTVRPDAARRASRRTGSTRTRSATTASSSSPWSTPTWSRC